MRKILEGINHHLDDYECMWNGIEDLYMNKTKEKIPDQFFFAMSGFCGFIYLKTNKAETKRMIAFGEGRTKQMYKFLAPIAGFEYHHTECKTATLALNKAKKEIDKGYPVVLGALDMYYLEYYPKLYHKAHIPFHYLLMIGYDDEKEEIYIYDCGRKDRLSISYENILLAMNAEYPGLCKPNTICTVRMENPKDKKSIAKECLEYKANQYLNPPTSFIGVNGMKKFASELLTLEKELGKEETIKIIKNTIDFFGSVPQTPNRLLGIDAKDDITYMCSRDKMSRVLKDLAEEYDIKELKEASEIFLSSGKEFEKLCDIFIDYVLGNVKDFKEASKIILQITSLESSAYLKIIEGIRLL